VFLPLPALAIDANYVGDKSCKNCHQEAYKDWKGSHHDLAMQIANENTVLGDFNGTDFTSKAGVISTFFKDGKKFMVRTDGPDGKLHDYEISYTFGLYPLQQYMVKFPKGKIQVLDIAWDSRSKEEGGQGWYHLHPHEEIKSDDVLHWTGPNLNWNFMCADCHSTNLKKNYNPSTKTFNTTYDVINVSCESCHAPASKHLKWAEGDKKGENGFAFHLKSSSYNHKTRQGDLEHKEVQMCAKCHSRRAAIDDEYTPGDDFFDHFENATLSEALYFPDGKIKDEVYVYNSFKQSKMYEAGVTCSDCHNPHSLKRKAVGEQVCYQCHTPKKYTASSHHKHKVGSKGSDCITCHMPSRVYMGVDERNDHSFRLPRPDLSVNTDIPNACINCHKDKDASWATMSMQKWYGSVPVGKQNFSHALAALRKNDKQSQKFLYEVLMSDAPDLVKATTVSYLGNYPSQQSYTTIIQMLTHKDVETRLNALRTLENFPAKYRIGKTFEMLKDKRKIVRTEAARQLSTLPQGDLDLQRRSLLNKVLQEFEETLLFNADRPESQNALAKLYMDQRKYLKAEQAYEEALRIQPMFLPSYINYAHYFQSKGDEKKAYELLQRGLTKVSDNADLHHALGLWHIRQKEQSKGLQSLQKAAKLDKDNARYQYVYAVALSETDIPEAIKILESSLAKHTGDLQTLYGLVYYQQKLGNVKAVEYYQNRIEALENFTPYSQ
jgi:tetratricopeptide (TPR) repeat protein